MDLADLSEKTGLSAEKLWKEISVMDELQKLPSYLPNAVVFGGTALNKVYFGDSQRLSYDIDIKCRNWQRCSQKLSKVHKIFAKSKEIYGFETNSGIKIELSTSFYNFPIVEREAISLLYYYGYNLAKANIKTYELEVLLAEKIIAFARRGTAKDLFDIWMGINKKPDEKKLISAIEKIRKRQGVNPYVLLMKNHSVDTDMRKIDVNMIGLDGQSMYKQVKEYLTWLFLKK